MKKSKLKNKVWFYLLIFAIVIICGIWFLQILSLDLYYELSKKSEIKDIATIVSKTYTSGDYSEQLNKLSFDKDVCIEITENNSIAYSTDSATRGCLINSREINNYKLEFMLSDKKSITYKVIHPNFKNKTLIYGVKIEDGTYAFISTSLEPIGSTVSVLKRQLIQIMIIVLLLALVIYKVSFDDFIDNAIEGLKKVIKPILLLLLVYIIFVIIYWAPFTVTISDWILKFSKGFNPFLATLSAFVSSLFHIDFGYTGYVLGDFMVNYFGNSFNIAFLVYVVTNGLVQIVAPTSVFVILGLSYLNIPYGKWIKHIWKFFVVMLAILLGIFAVLTYL